MENGYTDRAGGDKMLEINYEEQRYPDYNHYRIWWRMSKPISQFIKFNCSIDWLGLAIQKIDVMKDGKKTWANLGEITLFLNFWINVDWNKYFEDHPILKRFKTVYMTRWRKKDLEGHKMQLKWDYFRLHGLIKKHFEMWHYIPTGEMYHKKLEEV